MYISKEHRTHISTRQYPVEVLLHNYVTEDIQSLLRPLDLIQNVLLYPKYRIKDNFITSRSFLSTLVSICAALLFTSIFIYRDYLVYIDLSLAHYSEIYRVVICIFEVGFYATGFFMNTILTNRYQKVNIDFVLTIQEVHNNLNMKNDSRKIIHKNWICLIILFLGYLTNMIYSCIVFKSHYIHEVFCVLLIISFDTNILCTVRLIQYLTNKLKMWNYTFLNSESSADVNAYDTLLQTYMKILKCYEILNNTSKIFVLFHTIESFIHSLFYFKIFLDFFTSGVLVIDDVNLHDFTIGKILVTSYWLCKNIILQISLPVACASFYLELGEVQQSCSLVLSSSCSDEKKRVSKNIQRVHRATFSKMSACGLFYIDAQLPLQLMGFFTTYLIVLLQFAFL